MASLNKVFVIGNLGGEPDVKFVPSGQCVAKFSVAVNRKYKGGNQEWKEELTWVPVEVWGKTAEACAEYLGKGSQVHVEGRYATDEWTGQDGQKHRRDKVVAENVQFLSRKKEDAGA